MAAITATNDEAVKPGGKLARSSGTGTANQADALSSPAVGKGTVERLVYVALQYSGAATYTGTDLTVQIDSGLGASFDTTLSSGSDDTQAFVYSPDEEIWLLPGDAVKVSAPAAGSGVTASIVIVRERV